MKIDYKAISSSICETTIGGWVENLFMISIQIPAIFAMTILGVIIVQRYKIDIPKVDLKTYEQNKKNSVKEAEE